jgi:hypothetical protein
MLHAGPLTRRRPSIQRPTIAYCEEDLSKSGNFAVRILVQHGEIGALAVLDRAFLICHTEPLGRGDWQYPENVSSVVASLSKRERCSLILPLLTRHFSGFKQNFPI